MTTHTISNTKQTLLLMIGVITLFGFLAFCCSQLEASESSSQPTNLATSTLTVKNMTCSMCPITIRKSLEKIDGVSEADVSFDTKLAIVTYDPDKTNVKALIQATTNAGYPSSELSETSK